MLYIKHNYKNKVLNKPGVSECMGSAMIRNGNGALAMSWEDIANRSNYSISKFASSSTVYSGA